MRIATWNVNGVACAPRLRAHLARSAAARHRRPPGAQGERGGVPRVRVRRPRLRGRGVRAEGVERRRDPEPASPPSRPFGGSPGRRRSGHGSSERGSPASRSPPCTARTARTSRTRTSVASSSGTTTLRGTGPRRSGRTRRRSFAATSTSCPRRSTPGAARRADGSIFHTPEERSRYGALLDLGLRDLFRERCPDTRAYSWWGLPRGRVSARAWPSHRLRARHEPGPRTGGRGADRPGTSARSRRVSPHRTTRRSSPISTGRRSDRVAAGGVRDAPPPVRNAGLALTEAAVPGHRSP